MTESDPQPHVDPEHPWPALLAFREDDQRYFGGRKEEVEALYRRIASSRLTLLFGLSGLGKSSLLRAGLFPRLRGERYFPVYIRLRYGRDLPTPIEQIKSEIVAQARLSRIEAPEPHAEETLWQYFHRPDADFWDERNHPSTPVLVFDQFEELFTKSREVAEHANEVIEVLADLAEGASPALMREAAERDRSLLRQVFEDRYRLLIGIRSDYLAQLQGISDRVRAVFANRYELHRMSGAAALESTLTAGGHLMDEDVARRIVRFVAGAKEDGDAQSVDGLEVEPALLSLVCSELNATRIENHEPKITASMLFGTKDEILSRFYGASFADVAPELRVLVEDKLVTRDGKGRNFISEQTARETTGVTDEDLAKLVHRRLLRFEESGSSRRMELTHDLLTAVAAASRSTREQRLQIEEAERARTEAEQREASARRKLRRSRAAMMVFFILLLAALAGPFIAARWTAIGAKKVEADSAFRLALQKLSSEEPSEGLAYLARVIRLDRGNSAARTLLYEQLVTRSWPIPIRAFGPQGRIADAVFSDDGARVVFRIGQTIEMWDVATGKRIGSLDAGFEPDKIEFASDRWTVMLARGEYRFGSAQPVLWNPRAGRAMTFADVGKLPGLDGCDASLRVLDLSANGEELAVDCRGLMFVSLRTQQTSGKFDTVPSARFGPDPRFVVADDEADRVLDRHRPGTAIHPELGLLEIVSGFSPDGKRVLIYRANGDVEVWDLETAKVVLRFHNGGRALRFATTAVFDATGRRIMTTARDGSIRLWDARDGWSLFDFWHDGLRDAVFSADSARIVTASDRLARWWSARDGTSLGPPIVVPGMLAAHVDARGDVVTVSTVARVWQLTPAIPAPVLHESVDDVKGLSADGRFVFATQDGVLSAFDSASGKRRWTVPKNMFPLAVHPNGLRVVVVDADDRIAMVEPGTWRRLWAVEPRYENRGGQFSSDGTVVVLHDQESVNLLSAATGTPLAPPIAAPAGSLKTASRDASILAFRSDGVLRVWDVRKRRELLNIPEKEDGSTAISPDGDLLAVVTSGSGLRVWDAATGRIRTVKREEGEKLVAATFSPDGRRLALRSENSVALCDVQTLDCTKEGLAHPSVIAVAFSADSRRVVTRTDRDMRVWEMATKRPLTLTLSRGKGGSLSSDGTLVFAVPDVVTVGDRELYRVPLPSIDDDDDAERLAELGEALAGVRVDRLGVTETVDGTKVLADLGKRCQSTRGHACDIVRWLRTAPGKRTISPASNLHIADYVKPKLENLSTEDWWWLKARFPNEPALGAEP